MHTASLVFAIVCGVGFIVGLIPCIGWYNWFNIPLSIAGIAISIITFLTAGQSEEPGKARLYAIICMCSCGVAVVFGAIRLILGAGVF